MALEVREKELSITRQQAYLDEFRAAMEQKDEEPVESEKDRERRTASLAELKAKITSLQKIQALLESQREL